MSKLSTALALQFLQVKGIAHMDLKPQNLLLTGGNTNPALKVAGMLIMCFADDSALVVLAKYFNVVGTNDKKITCPRA